MAALLSEKNKNKAYPLIPTWTTIFNYLFILIVKIRRKKRKDEFRLGVFLYFFFYWWFKLAKVMELNNTDNRLHSGAPQRP
jgi:hypothetical protein